MNKIAFVILSAISLITMRAQSMQGRLDNAQFELIFNNETNFSPLGITVLTNSGEVLKILSASKNSPTSFIVPPGYAWPIKLLIPSLWKERKQLTKEWLVDQMKLQVPHGFNGTIVAKIFIQANGLYIKGELRPQKTAEPVSYIPGQKAAAPAQAQSMQAKLDQAQFELVFNNETNFSPLGITVLTNSGEVLKILSASKNSPTSFIVPPGYAWPIKLLIPSLWKERKQLTKEWLVDQMKLQVPHGFNGTIVAKIFIQPNGMYIQGELRAAK